MTRRERIVFLLEHLNDVLGPSSSAVGAGGEGDGPGFVLTSSMADHYSVVELCRCLDQLGRMGPYHREAVVTFFCANWYVRREPKRVKKGGRLVALRHADGSPVFDLRRERGLPPWLSACPVDRETGWPRPVLLGVDVICGLFDGDPDVPKQLLAAA